MPVERVAAPAFFLDTNVVVYSFSERDSIKREAARALVESDGAWISTQVLSELANVLTRRLGVPVREARERIMSIAVGCEVVLVSPPVNASYPICAIAKSGSPRLRCIGTSVEMSEKSRNIPRRPCVTDRVRFRLRRMRRATCRAALALTALLALHAAPADDARTWIAGATVISPDRADDGQKLNVLIEGDRIASIVKALPPGAARNAEVFDATGMYLIPGLIDSHVHLRGVPGFSAPMEYRHPFLTRDYRAQLPRSYLRYGYTTVIDLIPTDRDVLDAFLAAPAHPDLYQCGALPVRNGYPSHFAPRLVRDRVFPNFVVDPKTAEATDAEAHTPQAAVERVKKEGAICVKTFFERGFGRDRDLPVPSPELFAGIVKSARAAGLPVLLHASSIEAQRFGVEGGTDIFVHGMWNWNDLNGSTTLPASAREVLDRIASRGIGYMPTLQVIGGLRVLYEPGYFDQPAVQRVVPPSLLEWYRSPPGRWFKEDLAEGLRL